VEDRVKDLLLQIKDGQVNSFFFFFLKRRKIIQKESTTKNSIIDTLCFASWMLIILFSCFN
jgi:hypothetical protein